MENIDSPNFKNEKLPTDNTGQQIDPTEKLAPIEHFPAIHIIEKEGIKISYEESYKEFDAEIQEKFGIKGIRKKVVTEAPENFWEKFYEYNELFYALTEGEFPSFSTWNHAVWGDGGDPRRDGRYAKFLKEGEYFQTIHGKERARKGGRSQGPHRRSMEEKYRDVEGVFNLATLVSGDSCWRDSEDSPVFVFGNRNKRFKDYLRYINENPQIQKMLKLAGWSFTPKLTLGDKVDPSIPPPGIYRPGLKDKWIVKNTPYVYKMEAVGASEIDFDILREIIKDINRPKDLAEVYWALLNDKETAIQCLEKNLKETRDRSYLYDGGGMLIPMYLELGRLSEAEELLWKILKEQEGNEKADAAANILRQGGGVVRAVETYINEYENDGAMSYIFSKPPQFEKIYKKIWPYHFDKLLFLSQGVPCTHDFREMAIPAVEHPDIKPLRWCYADMEMVKNDDGKLEIRFFETE